MVRSALQLVLLVAAACLPPAQAAGGDQGASAVPAARQATGLHKRGGLEDRVRMLSKRLDLDAEQQAQLRKVLEDQREQVRKVWNDPSVPAAYRVSATHAISDQTEDRIRALLNEEQRKKFTPPRPPREAAGSSGPSVEEWMDSTRRK